MKNTTTVIDKKGLIGTTFSSTLLFPKTIIQENKTKNGEKIKSFKAFHYQTRYTKKQLESQENKRRDRSLGKDDTSNIS